jgi:phosphocarrier protein
MLTRKVAIVNQYGIHARPAAMMVRVATRFVADIFVEKDGTRVSGKSIMGLMTIEASSGSHLVLMAQGPDAEQALDELAALIEGRFGEE